MLLRTRVARRILGLFVACALLPVGALAVYSYSHVTSQLNDESRARLRQASKSVAMALVERLQLAEAELATLAATMAHPPAAVSRPPAPPELTDRFTGLAIATVEGATTRVVGEIRAAPRLGAQEVQHVTAGRSVLATRLPAGGPIVMLGRALEPRQLGRGILWSELDPGHLWRANGAGNALPPNTTMCVFDQSALPLYCSRPVATAVLHGLLPELASSPAGQFEWRDPAQGESYVAGYWSLPLEFEYATPRWTIVLSESKETVLAPMAAFKRTFPLAVLLALLVVLLLSNSQIRRSLDPLERLQAGTQRIARRDFSTTVAVASGDEFEELATSFNTMAHRLERQFHALTTINEIDRVVLSALDKDRIIHTLLSRAGDALGCDSVSVCLARGDGADGDADAAWTLSGLVTADGGKLAQEIRPTREERQELQANPDHLTIDARQEARSYLVPGPSPAMSIRTFLILPIFIQRQLSGTIALGYQSVGGFGEEDLIQARHLADRVTVGLSNARLLEQLDQLNWGTLTALARTIDASSPWTAGHSERVTNMALAIGRRLGLTAEQLGHLHRGGLLHDIGKLAIPPAILNKPGTLTTEEVLVMREHVRVGARILAPIKAYREAIPIVLYHHERYDGSGYPDGLAGDAIPLLARVFAVADTFDALREDRPYRRALPPRDAAEFVRRGSGTMYDPKVVAAFLSILGDEQAAAQEQTPSDLPAPSEPARPALGRRS